MRQTTSTGTVIYLFEINNNEEAAPGTVNSPKHRRSCHSGYSLVPAPLVIPSNIVHLCYRFLEFLLLLLGFSFCQAGYEVSNFLCLEHTFQLGARTVFAFCGRTIFVLVDLGFGRSLSAQKAPSLARSVRCRWHSRPIVTILTDPRLIRRPHWRWRWIRVDFPPFRPSEQWIDCRDRGGH